jgi:hypothetical protein
LIKSFFIRFLGNFAENCCLQADGKMGNKKLTMARRAKSQEPNGCNWCKQSSILSYQKIKK